jgi:hypothetical protein
MGVWTWAGGHKGPHSNATPLPSLRDVCVAVQAMFGYVLLNYFRNLILNRSSFGDTLSQVCGGNIQLRGWHGEQAMPDGRKPLFQALPVAGYFLITRTMNGHKGSQLYQHARWIVPGMQFF